MSKSGQQHSKADSGGQRPADPKKADAEPSAKGSTKAAIEAGKANGGAKKDAKK